MAKAKRFKKEGFVPEDNEYEVREYYKQYYSPIGLDELKSCLQDAKDAGDIRSFGSVRFRPVNSSDEFVTVDKRDLELMLECFNGDFSEHQPVAESEPAQEGGIQADVSSTHAENTTLGFCCHPLMKAMLAGNGTVVISMETGELLLGADAMHFCPFCGRPIVTYAPPIEVIEPEE